MESKVNSATLGLKQADSDLSEQQLKVLLLGDPCFSADQYQSSVGNYDEQEASVVLNPGDVLYHPAGKLYHSCLCINM